MSSNQVIADAIRRTGLGWDLGNAVCAIVEAEHALRAADHDNARMYLVDALARIRAVLDLARPAALPEPSAPAVEIEVREPEPATQPERKPTPKANGKAKAAKPATGGTAPRQCVQCGKTKGVTGFPSGSDTCWMCQGGKRGADKPGTLPPNDSRTLPNGAPPVKRVFGTRKCSECERILSEAEFAGDGFICRACEEAEADLDTMATETIASEAQRERMGLR